MESSISYRGPHFRTANLQFQLMASDARVLAVVASALAAVRVQSKVVDSRTSGLDLGCLLAQAAASTRPPWLSRSNERFL